MISYSSRALTKTEQNYAQIERECLSIKYACERNRLYLLGGSFEIYNALRIENMLLKVQNHSTNIFKTLGKNMSHKSIAW